jgi:hypothetical protein
MQDVTTTANLVDYETLDVGAVTAVLSRSEIEAALEADASTGLWFELGYEDEGASRLEVELAPRDLEEILRASTGDEVTIALDGDAVAGLIGDPDVEAHGLRVALAIAVVAGAAMAPAGFAATPAASNVAASPQHSSIAAQAQVTRAATKAQAVPAAKGQVTRAATKAQAVPAAKGQITRVAAKTQIARSLVVTASGVKLVRSGLVR